MAALAPAGTHSPGELARHLRAAIGEIRLTGPSARAAWAAAIAVPTAVLLAIALGVELPWWAGISAWMCIQPSAHSSLVRAGWRLVGTVVGAAAGFLIVSLFVLDHLAMHVALFTLVAVGHHRQLTSRYSYAWILATVTALMVVYAGLQEPLQAFHTAWYRAIEVTIGLTVAAVVAALIMPDGQLAAAAPVQPSPSEVRRSAIVAGITVSALPTLWSVFELPGISQFAISVVAVIQPASDQMHWKGLNRIAGCLLGGGVGLLLASLSHGEFPVWLAGLALACFVFAHLHVGSSPVSYTGTQAGIGLILALVTGAGPSDTIVPAVERLFAICGGLAVLTVVSLAVDAAADLLPRRRSTST